MGIAGIDEWGKSEECCNATPDPYDKTLTPRHDPYGKLMGIAGIDEWGKSEECCNATPDPYDC
jgi:hypothetical protein